MPHPPCSSSLASSGFYLFPQMKKMLRRKRFADVEAVKQKTAEALKGSKIKGFRNCFEQWKKCLDRCIASNRKYFEDD